MPTLTDSRGRMLLSLLVGSFAAATVVTYLREPPTVRGQGFRPFTAHLVERMLKSEESTIGFVSDVTFAQRSDGSWSHSYTSLDQSGHTHKVLEYADSAAMIFVHTEPVTESAMVRPLTASELPKRDCRSLSQMRWLRDPCDRAFPHIGPRYRPRHEE